MFKNAGIRDVLKRLFVLQNLFFLCFVINNLTIKEVIYFICYLIMKSMSQKGHTHTISSAGLLLETVHFAFVVLYAREGFVYFLHYCYVDHIIPDSSKVINVSPAVLCWHKIIPQRRGICSGIKFLYPHQTCVVF